ncbi:MAG: hypothetical protein M1275_02780, partial [Patescibacteria group bacterium]|nr:hypothetical protein [Patescibacteria group bacterium]
MKDLRLCLLFYVALAFAASPLEAAIYVTSAGRLATGSPLGNVNFATAYGDETLSVANGTITLWRGNVATIIAKESELGGNTFPVGDYATLKRFYTYDKTAGVVVFAAKDPNWSIRPGVPSYHLYLKYLTGGG